MKCTYGLIGRPLGHSFSPRYFAALFDRLRVEASYHLYELQQIDELPNLLDTHPTLCGLNVTLPYKREVLRYVDDCAPEVQCLQAANVLRIDRSSGKPHLVAYNTDVWGFYHSLLPLIGDERPKAWVFGTGGAASAVLYVLDELGISYEQVSRTPQGTQRSYDSLSYEEGKATRLWINATPVGLKRGEYLPLPYDALGVGHLCYDLIYNPSPTTFLNQAVQRGARIKDGLEMLHLQADKAWQLWTEYDEE